MARVIHIGCLILIHFMMQQQVSAQAVAAFTTAKTAAETVIIVRDNINYVKNFFTGGNTRTDNIEDKDVWMLNKLSQIDTNIITFKEQMFQKLWRNLASKLDLKVQDFADKLSKVNLIYELFMEIVENVEKYNNKTIDRFSKTVTSASLVELTITVGQLHTALYTPDFEDATMLSIISEGLEHNQMCGKNQSPRQMINELYKTVINADLKSIAIKLFAHAINQINDNTSYEFEIQKEIEKFKERAQTTYGKVVAAMRRASRDIWRCDPTSINRGKQSPNHEKGKTYSTLQEIFQSVLVFERDIKPSCYDQCSDYKQAQNSCKSKFCKKQKKQCRAQFGVVRDCMDLGDFADVCVAPRNSERQYDWSKTESGLIYGRDSNSCRNNILKLDWEYPTWSDAGRKILPAFRHCNYCLCTCEDLHLERSRYFNLYPVESDKRNNKVITGVRLRKADLVFQIEIQQGQLGPKGTINSVEWQYPIYTLRKENVLNLNSLLPNYPLYAVSWNRRTIYLDEIVNTTPKNKVLTGLRFKNVDNNLRLEAELTEFDYATGKLGKSEWQFNERGRNKRTALYLNNADDPVRHFNDAIYSNPSSYVQFQRSSIQKDMGQLTIPFVDTQDVVSDPPQPLAGISLFLRGTKGSGGFLAFKLSQYDFSAHF